MAVYDIVWRYSRRAKLTPHNINIALEEREIDNDWRKEDISETASNASDNGNKQSDNKQGDKENCVVKTDEEEERPCAATRERVSLGLDIFT